MLTPSIPSNEKERLSALYESNLLDTPAEERFDRITRLAIEEFPVSAAAISFLDSDRQWFKSSIGLSFKETSREVSFCGHTILEDRNFVVLDASKDPRFLDNPLVTNDPKIRFYVGCALHSPNGQKIGSLCLISDKATIFRAEDYRRLLELAYMAEQEIEDGDFTQKKEH